MYILGDIVYAGNNNEMLKVNNIKVIAELYMLVTFSSGEKRVFDVSKLLEYPIYKKLEDYEIFKSAYVENGIIVWNNGEIDVSPETVYINSFEYEQEIKKFG